jgi:hypothetical protein
VSPTTTLACGETEAKSPKLTIAFPRSMAGSTKEAEALLAELT